MFKSYKKVLSDEEYNRRLRAILCRELENANSMKKFDYNENVAIIDYDNPPIDRPDDKELKI